MDESLPTLEPRRSDFWRFAIEIIKTAFIVSILAYSIRAFVLQPFIVEGLSMFPQFHDHDYLLVDKLTYHVHSPSRGDIVVFKYPKDPAYNYVKRIIGLPGETVRIENSTVSIINAAHPNGEVLTESYVLPDNKTLVNPGTTIRTDFVVPQGDFFVMGDNRMGSSDSREWGMLPQENIIGKVLVQAYPLNRFTFNLHSKY